MAFDPVTSLDYSASDAGTNFSHLVSTMDAVSAWPEVRVLRAWERDQLELRDDDRLIDVGCGPGDAAVHLAADLGSHGFVLGVDMNEAMLRTARSRAQDAFGGVGWARMDAARLAAPDGSFAAARAERTLQWVPDPARVVAELHRLLRPGGRLGIIDTDWSTLELDTGDEGVRVAVRAHMQEERRRPSRVGARLSNLCHDAGFVDLVVTEATHVWTSWDPDRLAVPDGFFAIENLADDLVASGHLTGGEQAHFVESIKSAARAGRFFMALTMYAIAGRRR